MPQTNIKTSKSIWSQFSGREWFTLELSHKIQQGLTSHTECHLPSCLLPITLNQSQRIKRFVAAFLGEVGAWSCRGALGGLPYVQMSCLDWTHLSHKGQSSGRKYSLLCPLSKGGEGDSLLLLMESWPWSWWQFEGDWDLRGECILWCFGWFQQWYLFIFCDFRGFLIPWDPLHPTPGL